MRTEKGPRQRTVMQLGHLKLDRQYWPQLVAELECRISGQPTLDIPGTKISPAVKTAANTAMDNFTIHKSRRIENRKNTEGEEVVINLNDVCDSKYRSFGAEFVAHSTWNDLKLPQKLKELNFTPKERSLAEALVSGRLIKPASELATWEWLRNNSCIGELTE